MEAPRRDRTALALLWLAGALGCGFAAGTLVRGGGPNGPLWAGLATQGLWLGVALGVATALARGSVGERLGLGPGRLRPGTLAVLLLGFAALSNGVSALLVAVEVRDSGSLAEIDAMVERSVGPSFALAILALGVAPGIGEEILFRGLLQRGLVPRLGAAGGILTTAALFGTAHFDPVHGPAAFVLGGYLGCVAWLAGSTRAAIVCHVVNNTLAVTAAPLAGVLPRPAPLQVAGVLLPLAGALLAAAYVWEARGRRVGAPASRTPEGISGPDPSGSDASGSDEPGGASG